MSSFVQRREKVWRSAVTIAVIFWLGVFVALVFGGVPTFQKHGPDAGPGLIRRDVNPGMYYWLTAAYAATATVASVLAVFRFPWFTIGHLRLLFAAVFLLLFAMLAYNLWMSAAQARRAQTAWKQIDRLGGHAVSESDMVAVSLAGAGVKDDDLAVFADLRDVTTLDLSNNDLTDACLKRLDHLKLLEMLILVGTGVGDDAISQFKLAHPGVEVRTARSPKETINPFTGEPVNGAAK